MASVDDEKYPASSVEKLNGQNYRAWSTTMRAILREFELFDIVDGKETRPQALPETTEETEGYDSSVKAYNKKASRACRILISTIQGRLLTYVEDEDDPAKIWKVLKDHFRPTTDITLSQALKNIITMRMAEDGDMEAHIRNFTAAKRRLEEHGVALGDVVYRTLFLLSMPTRYDMTVTALEGMPDMTLEAVQNRLLEEHRKRTNFAGGMVMSALLTNQQRKPGKSHQKAGSQRSKLKCSACGKIGHVDTTCWQKHPELKPSKKGASINENAHFAFSTTSFIASEAGGTLNHWILDSGASEHFTPYRELYSTYEPLGNPAEVRTAKGKLKGIGIGSIHLIVEGHAGAQVKVTLEKVLHVPGMDSNLLSSNAMLAKGLEVRMHPTKGTNIFKDGKLVAKTVAHGKLLRLKTIDTDNAAEVDIKALKATGPKPSEPRVLALPYDVWHRRLAHLGPQNVKKLQGMATGIAIDTKTFPTLDDACVACIQGKQTRNLSDTPMEKRQEPGDLVHSDVCGWITPTSLGGNRYFLIFIDDATGMMYLYVMKTKTSEEVRKCFLNFRNTFERDGRRVKSIRTDGGGEYQGQMGELCKEVGIRHEVTAPYTPEQNGVAERANRTICERIRSILADTGLPKALWGELACTVVYLKNRSPTRALDKTPYEALYGKKPDLSHLVAVGTKAYVLTPKKKTKKMDLRSTEGIFVGYEGTHQYRVWDPTTNQVHVSRDVEFVSEGRKPAPARIDGGKVLKESAAEPVESDMGKDSSDEDEKDQDDDQDDGQDELGTITVEPEPESFVSAPTSPERSPAYPPSRGTTRGSRSPSSSEPDVRTSGRTTKRPKKFNPTGYRGINQDNDSESDAEAHMSCAYIADTELWLDPASYEEAIKHPICGKEWELAIKEEYKSLMKNGAWELVELPPGKNIVTCKWVFKTKHDSNGDIVRFKARLVARGFSQAFGIDYFETYAPVAKLTTYRTIFALAALEQWEIHGMDVITAFLLGKLDEEIYMAQPEGFVAKGMKAGMVCRLLRSIYGLKQASRVWNRRLHRFLIRIGFIQSKADPCLYVNHKRKIWITIWVDDLLIAGKDGNEIACIKKQLGDEFEMKDLGLIKHFLGMRITRENRSISIDQTGYIRAILERFGMEASKPVSTPLATGSRLVKAIDDDSNVDLKLYQGIIGSIMYAMLCTRVDLAFAIQQLSQFNSKPTNAHLQAAKRALRYLQRTQNVGLKYNAEITTPVQAYCDADYGAGEDRKSISGYAFMLAGSAISWQAKKQTTVALSTVESEYHALAQAIKEAIWLQNLFKDLNMEKYAPRVINCDNQGAIALAKNPTHHARTKHVDIELHFIRDHVELGTIELKYCPTDDMIADIMTKALARDRHVRLMGLMGLKTTTPSRVEDNRIGKVDTKAGYSKEATEHHGLEITSGSDELRNCQAHDVATSDVARIGTSARIGTLARIGTSPRIGTSAILGNDVGPC